MALSVGIVGFPNVGKSTLFKTLTKKEVGCSNYPFCTIDPNIGIVSVPDERLEKLSELVNPLKKTLSTVEFVDIAGLVEGASKGEGLGNKFLANIRETDIIVYVLRSFKKDDIITVRNEINPLREGELLDTELALKDLETIDKRILSLSKEVRALKKEAVFENETLNRAKQILENGEILINGDFSEEESQILKSYRFLTFKPRIYLINGKKEDVSEETIKSLEKKKASVLIMDVLEEYESSSFTAEEREALGLKKESGIDVLIREAYKLLDLITFFTFGPDEVRAWKTRKNALAPEAAGEIHTDFEKNFIKLEVIEAEKLMEVKTIAEARKQGLIRTEGKEYQVQDGDVIEVKHGG